MAKYAKDATRFDKVGLSADERRQMNLLKLALVMVTPNDAKKAEELTRIGASMEGAYGKGKWCPGINEGARELGFADTGAMWRAKYDMSPEDFTKELDRLWDQVRPLYLSLHAYVRMKLREKYGDQVPASGRLPAHLTGHIWAQDWANIFPLVSPAGAEPGYDLSAILKARKMTPVDMVKAGERFYTSIGFAPLPKTFWERSLLAKPRDREVVCHASA